ncbi:MAG: 4-alpha-glucanotransferase [Chitinophagaceae bacterium]
MTIQFNLRFHTKFGESLFIYGTAEELGDNDPAKALALEYLNSEFWTATINVKKKQFKKGVTYKYMLQREDGNRLVEACNDRQIDFFKKETENIRLVDTWNYSGEFENAFLTTPFKNVLLNNNVPKTRKQDDKIFSHVFKVKAPLIKKNELVCLIGSDEKLSEWSTNKPFLLSKNEDWWMIKLDLSDAAFPIAYKYGIFDINEKSFIDFEGGNNRLLYIDTGKKNVTIVHDGFTRSPNNTWKGAGVSIPVFSLRSNNSFGVGEFSDIQLLVDWTVKSGLKLIQLLPVNDTITDNSWKDSYPYSAISAFALHPLYVNVKKVAGKEFASQLLSLKKKQKQLNELEVIDYEEVLKFKLSVLRELYLVMGDDCLISEDFNTFFEANKQWLETYAAFSYLRDKHGTAEFSKWKTNAVYRKSSIARLLSPKSIASNEIRFYYFVQFHLQLQLKEATEYAHKKGVIVKGDIPIGISRNSCDAWESPEMYNMEWQAGAPPDDFAIVGQNWGFPTYNWKKMQEDGFYWWRCRFAQMNNYFDAFRIDHILGFFRIWSIPDVAVQGILGRFVPCIPIHINEFGEKGIWFDYQRYCRPFITDGILKDVFGENAEKIKIDFLLEKEFDCYDLAPAFETQREVQEYFKNIELTEENEKLKMGLFDLISNVILFEEEDANGMKFHFRIAMEKTSSFENLMPPVRDKIKELYINYFYQRQDECWRKEAMSKLPQLKASTNMLVCGEDLGMVPACVPDVMAQLGILSLEIQRMPKKVDKEFFHPNDAPYLSVITPSTHDMSTVRAWWQEDAERTQRFYNNEMGQWGNAPQQCEAWISRAIVLQHLYSPAMWSIFQLQDLLGMSEKLRRENPQDERINNPANPNQYWHYRMHISLEDLIKEKEFNEELKDYITNSRR